MTAETVLSFRKAGTSTWVDIDPSTERGRRLAALLGITTHPEKENTMSAATAETFGPGPRLRPTENPQVARMGLLVQAKAKMAAGLNRIRRAGRNAWDWLVRNLHLETARDYMAAAWNWLRLQLSRGMNFFGASGMAGLGLLGIASATGRKVLGFLWRPVGWVLKTLLKGWVFVEDSLHSDKREGGLRNWLSERMADVREFFIGNIAEDGEKKGIIGAGIGLYFKYVYPLLRLDTIQMKAARSLGWLMVGLKLIAAIAFLPLGGTMLSILTVLGYAGLAYGVTLPFADEAAKIKDWVVGFFKKEKAEAKAEGKKAETHGEKAAHTLHDEMEKEKAKADADLAAQEAAQGEPPNRAARRATGQTNGGKQTAGTGGRRR